jgi:enoyl-CoA hydratase
MMSRYGKYEYLRITVADGLATVMINRPDRDNAFDAAGHHELSTIIDDLAADDDVNAVLLGAEGAVFSAGGLPTYVKDLLSDPAVRERAYSEILHEVHAMVDFDKPVVAAINGTANGAALSLALLADVIITERQVKFRDSHVLIGLVAGDNAVLTWPASVSLIKAKRYLLTGDSLSAAEAERLGLVTEVVDQGQALARARVYAERFATGPAQAIRYTKRALNTHLREALPAFDYSLSLLMLTFTSDVPHEALRRLERGEPALFPRDTAAMKREVGQAGDRARSGP